MATIISKSIIDDLINANGKYEDDPQVVKIVEYNNTWGGLCWAIIYQGEDLDRYKASKFVINPVTIWEFIK